MKEEGCATADQQADLEQVNQILTEERLAWRKERLLAVKYVLEGKTQKEAGMKVNRSGAWACRMISMYRSGRIEELLKRRRKVGVSTPFILGDMREELTRVKQLLEQERTPWRQKRLLAIRRALEGGMSMREIGDEVGKTGTTIYNWICLYRFGGLKELLREKINQAKKLLEPSMERAMEERLLRDPRWTGKEVQRWLEEEHGLKVKLITVFKYLRECRKDMGLVVRKKKTSQKNRNIACLSGCRHYLQ